MKKALSALILALSLMAHPNAYAMEGKQGGTEEQQSSLSKWLFGVQTNAADDDEQDNDFAYLLAMMIFFGYFASDS